MSISLPHYHIVDSAWGDLVEHPIKTWNEAVRQLRIQSCNYFGVKRMGKATEGAYYLVELDYAGTYDYMYADTMVSIYTCTGEQPCWCEEEL